MTPEERAEALVRTRSVPDGTYEGRERVLFVGDVRLDGQLVFSRWDSGRHAEPGEVVAALRALLEG